MANFATVGSKIYIGGTLNGPAVTAASFTSVAWTEIGKVENLGSFGDVAEEVSANLIGEGRTIRQKGTRNAGAMELVALIDHADVGQAALLAAEATSLNYAFRVVFNDAPAAGTPSERRFVAMVMSAQEELGEANSFAKLNATLAINSNIVRVAAAAAGGGS